LPVRTYNGYTDLFLFIQNYLLFLAIIYFRKLKSHLVAVSSTYIHRIDSIRDRSPFLNRAWILSCIISVLFHGGLFLGSVKLEYIFHIPWWIHLITIVPIPLIIIINELVKKHGRAEWIRFQKRTKLEFNTKLGMHSPL
jgi:hypothetical protein